MIPFRTPLLSGGKPPLVQNYSTSSAQFTPPAGAKTLLIELLNSGGAASIGGDNDGNDWPDGASSGGGGNFFSRLIPAPTTDIRVDVASPTYSGAGSASGVYLIGTGYLLVGGVGFGAPGSGLYGAPTVSAYGQSGQSWSSNNDPGGTVVLRGGAAAWAGTSPNPAGGTSTPTQSDASGLNYGGGGGFWWTHYVSTNLGSGAGGYVRLTWNF